MRPSSTRSHGIALTLGLAFTGACGSSSNPSAPSSDAATDAGKVGDAGGQGDAGGVAAGQALVTRLACASCHGAPDGTLSGQTTPQPNTLSYPANLTPDKATGLGNWTDAQINTAILDGTNNLGRTLCPNMLRYRAAGLTEQDAQNITDYLRSLTPVSRQIPKTVSCTATAPDAGSDAGPDGGR